MSQVDKLVSACHFASVKHVNQRRKNKSKDPYINHPIEVMNILVKHGVVDVDTLCAAVLHDTVEDTGTTLEELESTFGEEVTKIVMECTDDKSLGKIDRKKLQIEHAHHISDKGKLVKLADKLSNIGNLVADPPEKWTKDEIMGYARWGYKVCEGLFGVSDSLDQTAKNLFAQFEIQSVTEDELNYYYSLIAHKP